MEKRKEASENLPPGRSDHFVRPKAVCRAKPGSHSFKDKKITIREEENRQSLEKFLAQFLRQPQCSQLSFGRHYWDLTQRTPAAS